MFDYSTINFAVYEDAVEYLGAAQVTLPDLTSLLQTIQGAGIAGSIEAPIIGQYEAMSMSINFRNTTEHSIKLSKPERHQIDLRVALENEDPVSGKLVTSSLKHILVVIPKSDKGGNIAPASPSDGSGEYAVRYWATYIDGKKVREIDPLNNICYIDGTDYLASVKKALGK